ncbi:MAG: Ig-like domain-containing protein, partial [Candidatus Shapirobacteria bacterium]|nr:Ig-like domain-containing protein [Candidatus Shapirobacteria bacterium]
SPSSLKFQLGDSQLLTANVIVQNGSVSRVNFTSANSTIASLNPTYVSSAPYTVAVYGNNVGSTTITAQALLNPSGSCSTPTSVPVSVEVKSWFQTQGGDVYTGGNLTDVIPETATDRNLSLELDNWPGVIVHQDTDGINLGSGFS